MFLNQLRERPFFILARHGSESDAEHLRKFRLGHEKVIPDGLDLI